MGTIVVSEFVTLDGVMEDPGGSEGFDRGDEGDKFKLDEVMEAEALLLGRVTYEGFAEAWPTREGDFADKFNTMPKYVVSTTLSDPEWSNSTVIGVDDIAALKDKHDGAILVNGSGRLVDALVDHGLVDEFRLMVFPAVIGGGKRLFGDTGAAKSLTLVDSRAVGPDGVVVLTYRPA